MTSKEKIRDIKSVINEFYHNEKCEGRLTEGARKSWLLFQEYCDDILQDLERLEALKKENIELRQDVLALEDYSYDVDCEKDLLIKENEKLKKAIEIFKQFIPVSNEVDFDTFVTSNYDYDVINLFKEVINNE
jgi:hypothetical protein